MKRWWFAALVAAVGVALFSASAQAKWHKLASSQSGTWIISDKIQPAGGDCSNAIVVLIYKTIQSHPRGQVWAKKRQVRICCAARSFQELGIILINPDKKEFHSQTLYMAARPAQKGTVADFMVNFVCRRTGGAQPGVPTTPQPVPPPTMPQPPTPPPMPSMPPIDGSGSGS